MKNFLCLTLLDIHLHARQLTEWAALILFFMIVLLLLPFAIGPEPDLLARLAPGLIWLAALLMSLLALEKLFAADARDGTLDLMLLSPVPLPLIVLSKLGTMAAIILIALLLMLVPAALMLGLSFSILPVLLASFVLGVPALIFLGGAISAVTIGLRRNPALLILLLIPFYIPLLIFAVAACDSALTGSSAKPHLLLLAAILAILLPTAPLIIAAALRNAER